MRLIGVALLVSPSISLGVNPPPLLTGRRGMKWLWRPHFFEAAQTLVFAWRVTVLGTDGHRPKSVLLKPASCGT